MSIRDAIEDFFSGGRDQNRQGSQPGGPDVRAPRGMTRPKMRPSEYTVPSGDDNGDTRTIPFADANPGAGPTAPKAGQLNYDNVPYFSGPRIRPGNLVFKDGMYVPTTEKLGLIESYMRLRSEIPKGIATDLRLGLGSLRGPEGFTDALEAMDYGTFRNDDGSPSAEALGAYANFQDASKATRDAATASIGDDYNRAFFDPCPEGYQTDPVTGMCVPVMGADPEPIVPTPFPDLPGGGGGGMTSPVLPLMDYTQPMNYTAPRISPPVPQGIAGIPRTPIIG